MFDVPPALPPRPPGRRPDLISVAELPQWVPGDILCASDELGWKDVAQRTFRYRGQDVEIPPPAFFLIVDYQQGATPMDREVDGRWTRTICEPGQFSLLSRSTDSHWHWTENLVVNHVYLSEPLMGRIASEMQGREIDRVELHDVLRGVDPVVSRLSAEIHHEAAHHGCGGALYAEAVSVQLAVHLLRRYATCCGKAPAQAGRLSARALARLAEYVDAHLHEHITIESMARVLGLGVWTLNRQLRQTCNASAYGFVVERRIERCQQLLRAGELPLKQVAAAAGFADQAHMTRTFRARVGTTPAEYRRQG